LKVTRASGEAKPRRRSLFERIIAHAKAGTAMRLDSDDVKRLASMPTIEGRARRHSRVLDDTPAPEGEDPTDWVDGGKWALKGRSY